MNDRIANLIALELVELPFITKASGCVKILSTKGKKRFPISTLVHFESEEFCEQEEGYVFMTPESKHVGVSFFEDLGMTFGDKSSTSTVAKGSLKLVVWVNLNKIGGDITTEDLKFAVMSTLNNMVLPSTTSSSPSRVKVAQVYPEWPSAFSKYSFDEERTQFLSPPYDHFALKIEYLTAINRNCAKTINLNPVEC